MEREARAISSLNHPNICQLYNIGSQDGTDYLVMEFLEGETLAERLRKGRMTLSETLTIGAGIAEALAVAHKQGIVHRDLKPGNIMLTKAGAKLMDFGLAKATPAGLDGASNAPVLSAALTVSDASPRSPLTAAGTLMGTIQYMSPEQIEGKEADARSDLFALGGVLYEMVTGGRAFGGKSQVSVAGAILEKEPEPISSLQPLTPPGFRTRCQYVPGEKPRRPVSDGARRKAAAEVDRTEWRKQRQACGEGTIGRWRRRLDCGGRPGNCTDGARDLVARLET